MAYGIVTLTTLQSRLQERIETSAFVVTAELTNAINEALRMWNLFTGTWRRQVTIALEPADPYVTLPQTMVFPMRVQVGNTPMGKSSLLDLDNGQPGWEGETAGDTGIPTTPQVWAPVSLGLIAVWPKVSATGTSISVDGVSATPTLSAGGDFIDLNESLHGVILGYAHHYLAFKRGAKELQATAHALQEMIKVAGEENALFKKSSYFRAAMGLDDKLVKKPFRSLTTEQRAALHRAIS